MAKDYNDKDKETVSGVVTAGVESTDGEKDTATAEGRELGATAVPASPDTPDTLSTPKETALRILKDSVKEDDPKPSPGMTFKKIIGGDILSADIVRGQIWLFLLIVMFTIVYVAFRYQCQQDMITIDKLENKLKDVKYKSLSSSSTLTERCRESHVLELLKARNDSLLRPSDQPPYIINVPEK